MDELFVEVCGENGANYKVNIAKSTVEFGHFRCGGVCSSGGRLSATVGRPIRPEKVTFWEAVKIFFCKSSRSARRTPWRKKEEARKKCAALLRCSGKGKGRRSGKVAPKIMRKKNYLLLWAGRSSSSSRKCLSAAGVPKRNILRPRAGRFFVDGGGPWVFVWSSAHPFFLLPTSCQ